MKVFKDLRAESLDGPRGPHRYARVTFSEPGHTALYLEVTAESDAFLQGYEVDRSGERIGPARGTAPACDERRHILDKKIIKSIKWMHMALKYATLDYD